MGTPQTYTDATSVAKFGTQANGLGWPRTDLLFQKDSDTLALVTAVVNRQSEDFAGISSIDVHADQAPITMYGVLTQIAAYGLETSLQFGIKWTHPAGGELDECAQLIGFHHNITMDGTQATWAATLRTVKA